MAVQHIFVGTAAPATTPSALGQHFIDTVGLKSYISVGTSSSANWLSTVAVTPLNQVRITFDGSGQPLTTGSKTWCSVKAAGTISSYVLLADVSGDIVISVKQATFSAFPTFVDTSVTGASGVPPTLSSAQKAQDSTLTNWTGVSIAAGQILEFEIVSATTVSHVQLFLNITG